MLSVITCGVFALIVFALFFALFTRAVYLWIMIIFSPVFGLIYFVGDKKDLL